ncbi:putative Na+/H+ antiporter [Coraliomargarita parva]|uniref:putative Na+/H+ antiporter n=1 Tax=Coraliomargarita parva TaxID=3014050 RepID=UPI0022B2BCE2|nr:putative Na+/H+ antiporter [Coraliomargarita parva]
MKQLRLFLLLLLPFLPITLPSLHAAGGGDHASDIVFPLELDAYTHLEEERAQELGIAHEDLGLIETLKVRAKAEPMNIIATLLFFGAILHTFAAGPILKKAHQIEHEHNERIKAMNYKFVGNKDPVSFKATMFHFLGEVEAVFGIWVFPLLVCITLIHGWDFTTHYIDTRNYTEPVFVVIIMAIASSRPVVLFAERALSAVASIGKRTPAAWWLSILIIAPLLGSFITEPAAMTIAALLLGHQFYQYNPTPTFKYATLGLLFVNVSVGGTLTHFAAPPVLMVAGEWGWNMPYMLEHFGWRAALGIVIATLVYFFVFRKNFASLTAKASEMAAEGTEEKEEPAPFWIIAVHLVFLAWTVFTLHHPALFIGSFLCFIAFTIATDHHQYAINLKGPLLVGFFLAGLVTHGGLQGWWIAPVLSALGEVPLFLGATCLTAFNDNAAITFLASQVPAFDQHLAADTAHALALQYAVVAGAVTGGGLTVIANAPNPAGQSILSKYFDGGVSPLKLLLSALFPTLVMIVVFMLLPHLR